MRLKPSSTPSSPTSRKTHPRAKAVVQRILRCANRIGHVPRAGRKVPEYQLDTLREVFERPYRIIYRIKPDVIEIMTVMHYRQLLPDDLV